MSRDKNVLPKDILDNEKNAEKNSKFRTFKICITGGPCAGKTTGMAEITKYFSNYGFSILTVPEVATLTMSAGGNIIVSKMELENAIKRQVQIVKMIKCLENYFEQLSRIGEKKQCIIICDRGCMDPRAYISDELWQAISDEMNWNAVNLSHKRYDTVIHMVTAADGAKEFYTTANNMARYETVDEAIEIDNKLQQAYTGHPDHRIIKNRFKKYFSYKIARLISELSQAVGLDGNQSNPFSKSKYLCNPNFRIDIPKGTRVEEVQIKEIFLVPVKLSESKIKYRKLIKHESDRVINYYIRKITYDLELEKEQFYSLRKLSVGSYFDYLEEKDDQFSFLRYQRQSFIYKKNLYTIDKYNTTNPKIVLLLNKRGQDDCCDDIEHLPDFLKDIVQDIVTDNKQYSKVNLVKTVKG